MNAELGLSTEENTVALQVADKMNKNPSIIYVTECATVIKRGITNKKRPLKVSWR
ncbi:hypothetical protein L1D19_23175 [Vibrio natriegens]|uniref:hypothetical protein n=1 Tax=Vibrio natriegens TaxID=691 RepID=UPI001EFDE7EF|nr:hypothetical protein [Vibrio natriegens]MCG9702972.1 hypothetical protein [Vibrio natriegens]